MKLTSIHPETGEIIEHVAHKGRNMTVDGQEVPDPTPMAPPLGYKRQPSMHELIKDMVRSERLRQEAEAQGHESFEDADDFDVDDDDEIKTPYEVHETESVSELRARMSAASADDGSAVGAEPKEPKAPPRQAKKPPVRAPEPAPEASDEED